MAISKKRLRKIVVEGEVYYWKFNEKTFVTKEDLCTGQKIFLVRTRSQLAFNDMDIWTRGL